MEISRLSVAGFLTLAVVWAFSASEVRASVYSLSFESTGRTFDLTVEADLSHGAGPILALSGTQFIQAADLTFGIGLSQDPLADDLLFPSYPFVDSSGIGLVSVVNFFEEHYRLFAEPSGPSLNFSLGNSDNPVTDLRLVQIPERNQCAVALVFTLLSLVVFRSRCRPLTE
jgi:hypothetical protein